MAERPEESQAMGSAEERQRVWRKCREGEAASVLSAEKDRGSGEVQRREGLLSVLRTTMRITAG